MQTEVCILQYPKPSMCVYEAYVRERDGERGGLEFTFDHRAVVMPLAFWHCQELQTCSPHESRHSCGWFGEQQREAWTPSQLLLEGVCKSRLPASARPNQTPPKQASGLWGVDEMLIHGIFELIRSRPHNAFFSRLLSVPPAQTAARSVSPSLSWQS